MSSWKAERWRVEIKVKARIIEMGLLTCPRKRRVANSKGPTSVSPAIAGDRLLAPEGGTAAAKAFVSGGVHGTTKVVPSRLSPLTAKLKSCPPAKSVAAAVKCTSHQS